MYNQALRGYILDYQMLDSLVYTGSYFENFLRASQSMSRYHRGRANFALRQWYNSKPQLPAARSPPQKMPFVSHVYNPRSELLSS